VYRISVSGWGEETGAFDNCHPLFHSARKGGKNQSRILCWGSKAEKDGEVVLNGQERPPCKKSQKGTKRTGTRSLRANRTGTSEPRESLGSAGGEKVRRMRSLYPQRIVYRGADASELITSGCLKKRREGSERMRKITTAT